MGLQTTFIKNLKTNFYVTTESGIEKINKNKNNINRNKYRSSSDLKCHLNIDESEKINNFVDEKGVSKGLHDGEIDISSYYKRDGALVYDKQRETKYTQNLAERIIDRYKK